MITTTVDHLASEARFFSLKNGRKFPLKIEYESGYFPS